MRRVKSNATPGGAATVGYEAQLWQMADARRSSVPSPSTGEGQGGGGCADIPGFRKSTRLEEVRKHDYVLTPGRYVGAEAQEDDGEPFADKMKRLSAALREQQAEAVKLDAAIAANLRELVYGG